MDIFSDSGGQWEHSGHPASRIFLAPQQEDAGQSAQFSGWFAPSAYGPAGIWTLITGIEKEKKVIIYYREEVDSINKYSQAYPVDLVERQDLVRVADHPMRRGKRRRRAALHPPSSRKRRTDWLKDTAAGKAAEAFPLPPPRFSAAEQVCRRGRVRSFPRQ
jgi:hypothetical protein